MRLFEITIDKESKFKELQVNGAANAARYVGRNVNTGMVHGEIFEIISKGNSVRFSDIMNNDVVTVEITH